MKTTPVIWAFMKGLKKNNAAAICLALMVWLLLLMTPLQALAKGDTLVVMFYNVENFFDVKDDTLKRDDYFLPEGSYHWTYYRYKKKSSTIARVISSANGWKLPSLVGMCEVENASVLKQLIYGSGMGNAGYDFIHFDSPDLRGIDVALLYNRYLFKILETRPVSLSSDKLHLITRDALYAKMVYSGEDTLHVVVNHWPSKRGGEKASEPKRAHAATTIRQLCDSILAKEPQAKLILMGDFNDEASSNAIRNIMEAGHPDEPAKRLINLSVLNTGLGSHKFQGAWSCIDHIIIARSLWNPAQPAGFKVVELPFLLENDDIYSGVRPFRTYAGQRYLGGYSDHLPVMAFIPVH